MKPLDFVITPEGNIAIVTATTGSGSEASINFIGGGNPDGEHNAWWYEYELTVIDSLGHLLSIAMAPSSMCDALRDVDKFHSYKVKK